MPNRSLDALSPAFKPLAIEFLARTVEANLPVLIVQTLRTEAEQKAALAAGKSWITHSKHQDGNAIDVCLWDTFQLKGPDKLAWAYSPEWLKLGEIGEKVGLTWGGRWKQKDLGHFEL